MEKTKFEFKQNTHDINTNDRSTKIQNIINILERHLAKKKTLKKIIVIISIVLMKI